LNVDLVGVVVWWQSPVLINAEAAWADAHLATTSHLRAVERHASGAPSHPRVLRGKWVFGHPLLRARRNCRPAPIWAGQSSRVGARSGPPMGRDTPNDRNRSCS
jgi:hypothetical protein